MSSGTRLLETMQRDAATRLDSAFADDPNIAPYVDDIYGYLQPGQMTRLVATVPC